MVLGDIIRKAREAKNLTGKDLAELVGKSPAYICFIEVGDVVPPAKLIKEIGIALMCPNINMLLEVAVKDKLTIAQLRLRKRYGIEEAQV